ncbi:MAG TPA: hypothetical protein VJ689_04180, partial [Gaiellaceae bacterium]|nr:hypothetical protein [Gaiellaceae bacterium]
PVCTRLYARGAAAVVPPIVALSHRESGSITGGPLEAAGRRPQRSRYFYADWARGWLRVAILDDRHRLVGRPRQLATGLAGPSSLRLRPDGWLYYLAFGSGELRRIGRDGCADRGEGSSRDCFRASPPR